MTTETVSSSDFKELLGEGFHTAFRKGVEGHSDIHESITKMDPSDWDAVLEYVVDGLDYMGFQLVHKPE